MDQPIRADKCAKELVTPKKLITTTKKVSSFLTNEDPSCALVQKPHDRLVHENNAREKAANKEEDQGSKHDKAIMKLQFLDFEKEDISRMDVKVQIEDKGNQRNIALYEAPFDQSHEEQVRNLCLALEWWILAKWIKIQNRNQDSSI